MSKKLKIRTSRRKDLEDFILLKKHYLEDASMVVGENITTSKKQIEEEFLTTLKKRNEIIYLAELNDQVIGFMKVMFYKKRTVSYLADIFIEFEYQGNGLGKQFFKEFLRISKEAKVSRIGLGVHAKNKRAFKMYEQFGFEIIGYNLGKKLKKSKRTSK